jgi:hypothetical protein
MSPESRNKQVLTKSLWMCKWIHSFLIVITNVMIDVWRFWRLQKYIRRDFEIWKNLAFKKNLFIGAFVIFNWLMHIAWRLRYVVILMQHYLSRSSFYILFVKNSSREMSARWFKNFKKNKPSWKLLLKIEHFSADVVFILVQNRFYCLGF